MRILALETSAKAVSAAITEDGRVLASGYQDTGLTHSRTLMPIVEHLLKNTGMALKDCGAVAVAAGPGSFTGIRIGVSAAKGLAWAAEKPCAAVSTLAALARNAAVWDGLVVCAMDARRQQVYHAVFRASGGALERLRADCAVSLEEAAAGLEGLPGPVTVVGDGSALLHSFLRERGIPSRMAPAHLCWQSAAGVGMAAARLWPEGAVSAQAVRPTYLRLSQAERERLAKMESEA